MKEISKAGALRNENENESYRSINRVWRLMAYQSKHQHRKRKQYRQLSCAAQRKAQSYINGVKARRRNNGETITRSAAAA
jgi:hypothetical protein